MGVQNERRMVALGIAVAFLAIAVSYAFAPDSECNTPTPSTPCTRSTESRA